VIAADATTGEKYFMNKEPLISILMPSFNQAEFLPQAIESVLDQQYPAKELIVIDGGSTDGSRAILERYAAHLAYWVSEPDRGQTHALNKALQVARGDILGWQNSDDFYYPGAFAEAADLIGSTGCDLAFGNLKFVDASGVESGELRFTPFRRSTLLYEGTALSNQSAFWTRALQTRVGEFTEGLKFCMDFDFYLRAAGEGVFGFRRSFWGAFREHAQGKSTLIADIGLREHQLLLERWAPETRNRARSHALKIVSGMRRLVDYVGQGDATYAAAGLVHRFQAHS
jgi:glycosyltransferase involved in cell wall biosynthesis